MGEIHAKAIEKHPLANLALVSDVDEKRAACIARRYGTKKYTTDFDAVFEDASIHAVVIATPAKFHKYLILRAHTAGKHVFCEKRLCPSLAEVEGNVISSVNNRNAFVPSDPTLSC
eukprot:TRINITY_DN230_c0_g1_i10.p3 TRINITY_DN230_c0_g1~~TRINITY_DN230_c0_g1_i10.p3  ORF type:complete len:116 (+),score=17.43 TRINITY_DN230_c0_g1_i10:1448-1795(+)